ncbi:hypothetical protein MKW92_013099 [Papaver armeniacum]|nr:hypothetical protein MKW92_013099 [Papaver armeniacum]
MYNRNTRDIVLWNPATRQCRVLPKSLDGNPKDGYDHRDFVGLGFDVESKDYKVIQVSSLEPKKYYVLGQTQFSRCLGLDILRKVQIYCLSTDSWRLIDSDFRIQCFSPAGGRSLNGIYFHQGLDYTTEPSFKTVILSFDLNKEKYQRVLQIPDDNFLMITSIGDKLACISVSGERCGFDKEFYTVWMLNDYDNTGKEFWTELYRVDVMSPKIQKSYIVAVLWNGELGLFGDQTLGLYNFITDEFEDLGFGEEIINLCTLKTTIYEESLVSVYAAAKTISS